MQKTPPAFEQTDGDSTIAYEKVPVPTIEVWRPVVALAMSMTLNNYKSSKLSRRNKPPASLSSGLGWPQFPATVNVAAT